jgi:DNA polymerase III subunit delta'
MKTLAWKNLIGQERIKASLLSAVANGTLGHAYLLCGDPGTGTFQAALELSLALLCANEGEVPCRACEPCRKALRNAHPDFHVIMPVTLEKEHKDSDKDLNQEGWTYLSSLIQARIAEPYRLPPQTGMPSIPVDWVKEINHAIRRGAIEKGKNIAIFDGIDIMNKEAANAMLATLEAPPENTLMLLITQRPQAVLPTIASRCQLLRFGSIPATDIRNVLVSRYGSTREAAIIDEAVSYCMGSLGRALDLCENPMRDLVEESRSLLRECSEGDWLKLASHVDALTRQGFDDRHENLLMHLIYFIRNGFLQAIARDGAWEQGIGPIDSVVTTDGTEIFSDANPEFASRLFKACQGAIDGIHAHGNSSILLVNFMITIMEILREQKQQFS